ncbi:MAG: 6-hydroxycyclohex-1-ene-1-carbonyl-CoA dehydrogenase [Candidatus Omnitrophica bacterium]|nr:6-hydroxycyclohex-1-ene-1-carbonyl-CoA dehydrogenase [Candidatus Omnitrophota bacterium]
MKKIPEKIVTWQMLSPHHLERVTVDVPDIKAGEALIEIAGCGICHSDISYFYGEMPIAAPRTLGHEISGTIIAGDAELIGKEVIIPAVMPCHSCPICKSGMRNRCLSARIPGYTMGIYGGNSSHIVVPTADLCFVDDKKGFPLSHLAVVADAVASAYQGSRRVDIQLGDRVIVVGATGGAGVYAVQICAALGASEVIGIARNQEKLQNILNYGATYTISTQKKSSKEVVNEFHAYCSGKKLPSHYGWKILEWSGSPEGQEIALELLPFAGKMLVGGFGKQINNFPLSRLMVLNAEIIGTWACLPEYYPDVLRIVLNGKIKVEPFIKTMPMSQIKEAYENTRRGGLAQRIILTPDF